MPDLPTPPKTPLFEEVKTCLRLRHYSIRSEEACVQFIGYLTLETLEALRG